MKAATGALEAYSDARRRHKLVGPRDWLVSVLANGVVRLASRPYRRVVGEAIHEGLLAIAQRESRIQPYTEPDDPDPYLIEAGERLRRAVTSLDSYAAASFPCPMGHSEEADAAVKAWDETVTALGEKRSSIEEQET